MSPETGRLKLRLSHLCAAVLVACCALVGSQHITANAAVPSPFDTTFGTNGVVRLDIPLQRSQSYAKSMISDSNGKIVALFHVDEYSNDPKVVIGRSLVDGVTDTSFGTNGATAPVVLQGAAIAFIPSSEEIVLAGYRYGNRRLSLLVYKFSPSGVLDTTFGSNGYFEIQGLPGRGISGATPMIAATSSRIHVGFEIGNIDGSNQNFYFTALDHDGIVDYSWGSNGGREVAPIAPGGVSAWSTLNAMSVLSDGSLLAVGSGYSSGSGRQTVLVKLNSNGYLDPSFDGSSSGNGIVKISFGTQSESMMTAITVLQDGGFVVAGQAGSYFYGPWYYGMAKFLASGVVDTTFGTNGFALSTLADNLTFLPSSVVVESDGKYVFPVKDGTSMGFMRVQSNGTFNSAQGCFKCLWSPSNLDVRPFSMLLQSSGKIIVAGAGVASGSSNASVVRFLANGTVDTSFGIESVWFDMQQWTSWALKSSVQPDGSIIVLGQATSGNFSRPVVFKLTPTGVPDQTFGSGGYKFLFPPSDEGLLWSQSIAVQTNGKIVVLAEFRDSNINIDDSVVLWRLNSDGTTDNSFGTYGRTVTSDAQARLQPSAMVLLSSGKILVSLTRRDTNTYSPKPWVFRYLPDGSLDTSFTDSNNFAGGIQPTPGDGDGEMVKIYAAGNDISYITSRSYINSVESVFVARLLADGTIDPTFAGGRATWTIGQAGAIDGINDLHVGTDGKITISAWASNPTNTEVIIQLLPNGSLDTGFNGNGRVTYMLRSPVNIDWVGTSSIIRTADGVMVAGGGAIDDDQQFNFLAVGKFTSTGALDSTYGNGGVVLSDDSFNGSVYHIVPLGPTTNLVTGFILSNSRPYGAVMKVATSMPPPTTVPPSTNPPTTTSTTVPPATTVPAATTSTDDTIKLSVSTTQSAILKRLKVSVPKGGKVSMKSTTSKVCRVSGTKVIASSPGTCRINVTVTVKGKKSTKTVAIKVT